MRKFLCVKIEIEGPNDSGLVEVNFSVQEFELREGQSFADQLCKKIGTSNFDVKQVQMGEHLLDVWHDDYYNPSEMNRQFGLAFDVGNGQYMPIFGSVVFAGCDDEGSTISSPIDASELDDLIQKGKIRFISARPIEAELSIEDAESESATTPNQSAMLIQHHSNYLH